MYLSNQERGENMQALLSDEASQQLANSLLEVLSRKIDDLMLQKQKRYLNQTELCDEYDCNHRDIERWLALGLPRRKQGTKWIYDRLDVDVVVAKEKITYI